LVYHDSKVLRVISFRDEIVEKFGAFHKITVDSHSGVRSYYTARELKSVLLRHIEASLIEPLNVMVSEFEEAKYSGHRIGVENYRKFYLAQKDYGRIIGDG